MIHEIKNKKLDAILKNENIELPNELRKKIEENFEKIISTGANVWNGEIFCVTECNIKEDKVEITCKKSDYAHYLYGEKIGCPKEYECKNLSAGCLLETADDYLIIVELDENTSYPTMLQIPGGNVDKKDIIDGIINAEKTIKRETMEEININLDDKEIIIYNTISYIYIAEENEQPGIQLFSKAKTTMTSEQIRKHFANYYIHLKEKKLERELKKVYFLKKQNAVEELKQLRNPKRNWLMPLIQIDSKENSNS